MEAMALVRRLPGALALAAAWLVVAPAWAWSQAGGPEAMVQAAQLGLWPPGGPPPAGARLSRLAWSGLLYEAFAGSILGPGADRDLQDAGSRARFIARTGWLRLTPADSPTGITRDELLSSLAAARRTLLGQDTWAAQVFRLLRRMAAELAATFGWRPRAGPEESQVTVEEAVALLLPAIRSFAPRPGGPGPAATVHSYYSAWQAAVAGPDRGGTLDPRPVMPYCTGQAATNLVRNSALLAGQPAAVLSVAATVLAAHLEGHLAEVTVNATTHQFLGGRVQAAGGRTTLRLRLTPGGWRIYL